jgi:hypothetical protein
MQAWIDTHWVSWLTPIILAMWEVEIWRIMVQTQPRQKVRETTSQPMAEHLSSPATWDAQIGGSQSGLAWAESETLSEN